LLYPERVADAYDERKTVLRDAGIFGSGDRQVMSRWWKIIENKRMHFQLGDSSNLFDWTYVTNVAYAHLLAAITSIDPKTIAAVSLSEVMLTVQTPRLPTSKVRPVVPAVEPTPAGCATEEASPTK